MQVAFIFTDAEVREEAFLEYINQLLATGEVAGLFGRDEVDGIVNDVRPIMRAEASGLLPPVGKSAVCLHGNIWLVPA